MQPNARAVLEQRTLFSSPSLWASHGNGGGGTFLWPSIDPRNAANLTIESDMTGQYRSTNGGASWKLTDAGTFRAVPNVDTSVRYTRQRGVEFDDRRVVKWHA